MKILEEVKLPEWTRIMWGNLDIRNEWEPKIESYKKDFESIEIESVKQGYRKAALVFYSASTLAECSMEFVKDGLTIIPLDRVKNFMVGTSPYVANVSMASEDDTDALFRCLICQLKDFEEVKEAGNSDLEIGRVLGYPKCCREFFQDVWIDKQFIDTSWQMAVDPDDTEDLSVKEFEDVDARNNVLWRWMGIRAASHLPCSFNCEETKRIGEENLSLLSQENRDVGLEILSWPVEWSALHGIVEIKTPILKVSAKTDVTPTTYTVRLKSDKYPKRGISGVNFPFKNSASNSYTQQVSFRSVEFESEDWYYQDNGFSTLKWMNASHKSIVNVMRKNNSLYNNVVDLGCGNGALLYKLNRLRSNVIPYGCDHDKYDFIKHSKIIHPDFSNNFQQTDIAAYVKFLNNIPGVMFDLCLLTPTRISEYDEAGRFEDADAIRYFIKNKCKYVLLYSYGDNLTPSKTGGVPSEATPLEAAKGTFQVAKLGEYQIIEHQDNSFAQSDSFIQPFITTATLVTFNMQDNEALKEDITNANSKGI